MVNICLFLTPQKKKSHNLEEILGHGNIDTMALGEPYGHKSKANVLAPVKKLVVMKEYDYSSGKQLWQNSSRQGIFGAIS